MGSKALSAEAEALGNANFEIAAGMRWIYSPELQTIRLHASRLYFDLSLSAGQMSLPSLTPTITAAKQR